MARPTARHGSHRGGCNRTAAARGRECRAAAVHGMRHHGRGLRAGDFHRSRRNLGCGIARGVARPCRRRAREDGAVDARCAGRTARVSRAGHWADRVRSGG